MASNTIDFEQLVQYLIVAGLVDMIDVAAAVAETFAAGGVAGVAVEMIVDVAIVYRRKKT